MASLKIIGNVLYCNILEMIGRQPRKSHIIHLQATANGGQGYSSKETSEEPPFMDGIYYEN